MFTETDGSRKAIGDVDVLYHEGVYHLFHLVLPNHDFIAHAVSTDGIHWRRVKNALFIGPPGSWDDLMLWTMHVSPDPAGAGKWRMFYTGLSRKERGNIQRLGLATSDDLYTWEKAPVWWQDERGINDPDLIKEARKACEPQRADSIHSLYDESSCFPIEPSAEHYESSLEEGRRWVSFRDPFFGTLDGQGWLIMAARVKDGPVVRRGCVGLAKEVSPNQFKSYPALHHPQLYDDVEVPGVFELGGRFYMIGSIREDAKIRYWHADQISGPWRSYHDNVLMPQGNYAGRLCRDDKGWLLWGFFAMNRQDRTADNIMPPPKRLSRDDDGLLYLKTFEEFQNWTEEAIDTRCVDALKDGGPEGHCRALDERWEVSSPDGFQVFVFQQELKSFWLTGTIRMQGKGKCGLVLRVDPDSHDGYYLSLDLLKGVAQLRTWGTAPNQTGEHVMQFDTLQSGFWYTAGRSEATVSLLAYGSYLELSINGRIVLSLADQTYRAGLAGVYLDTASLNVDDLKIHRLRDPEQVDDQLVGG
ncbi:hypothetical protein [Haloferula rosea]|uniref:beta-fructofuranosidase n=1 Tax=Haloferula rosea TaxID=490093 RepID=A0A934RF99_9BACT|nr:hypothetical protein [Haloferula rosea]MBK1828071.1 hypothetical protein [Haloferula rosea]